MRFVKALALLVAIPIFGFSISEWVLSDIESELDTELEIELSLDEVCSAEFLSVIPELRTFCSELSPIFLLRIASIYSALVALGLLISFSIFAAIAGTNRKKVAVVFPPLVFVSLLVVSGLVLVQGGVLTYGAYLGESHAIGRVHFILIGAIGLGALVGCLTLIGSAFKLGSKQSSSVLGKKLDRGDHQDLYAFVDNIAEKLGAQKPNNIVVGLEPNFYVTSVDIQLFGANETLKGETLYLSLALARILTKSELTAIAGHELGHFRGNDTYYSLKFSPVYAGLSHALGSIGTGEEEAGVSKIATLPAFAVLTYMIDVFHKNVSTISREREFEADKAAAEIAHPINLATSLLKIGLYAQAWRGLQHRVIGRLAKGKVSTNLSQLFSSIVQYDINTDSIPKVIEEIGKQTVSHPTDSHPPTAGRIESVGLDISSIDQSLLLAPDESSIDLISDARNIEEELTTLQQSYYVSLGVVTVPDEPSGNLIAQIIAAFGAHMIMADGDIEAVEIDSAEAIGMSLTDEFDNIDLRQYCHYPETLPTIEKLLEMCVELSDEAKELIADYMGNISESDEDVSEEENALLLKVKESFGLTAA